MIKTLQEIVAAAKQECRVVTPAQAAEEISKLDKKVCIDVREPGEHAENHVEGFINIPRGVLEMNISSVAADENTPIFLHCATGGRASLAAQQLRKMGFQNITVIEGNCEDIKSALCQIR